MKNLLKSKNLPILAAGLGGIAMVLRVLMYRSAVDEKNLLVESHPLVVAVWLLTGAVLLLITAAVWKLDGSDIYEDNFTADVPAFVGHGAAAAGIAITVLTNAPATYGYLGTAWKILGYLAPVCLVLAGFARMRGRQPFFLLHMIPCLFLVVHIVNHYQLWCSNPQLVEYVFTLFGTMAAALFGFYLSAFDVGAGKRRMLLGMGLAAVYLCVAEMADTLYPCLYLGCALWALTGLCSPEPKAKKNQEVE